MWSETVEAWIEWDYKSVTWWWTFAYGISINCSMNHSLIWITLSAMTLRFKMPKGEETQVARENFFHIAVQWKEFKIWVANAENKE